MNLSLPGPTDFPPGFYTLAEGILISVRHLQLFSQKFATPVSSLQRRSEVGNAVKETVLQRSEGDVSTP